MRYSFPFYCYYLFAASIGGQKNGNKNVPLRYLNVPHICGHQHRTDSTVPWYPLLLHHLTSFRKNNNNNDNKLIFFNEQRQRRTKNTPFVALLQQKSQCSDPFSVFLNLNRAPLSTRRLFKAIIV